MNQGKGRDKDALAVYENALSVSPESFEVLNQLGVEYLALDRPLEAAELFKKAIRINDNAVSRLNLGQAYTKLEKYADAVAHNKVASTMLPNSAEAQRRLANALELVKNYKEAEIAVARSLALENHLPSRFQLANLLEKQKLPHKIGYQSFVGHF